MRVIRFFFTTLLVLSILAGMSFLLGREALLIWAKTQVNAAQSRLAGIGKNAFYRQQCYDLLGRPERMTETVAAVQLRFEDDTQYRLEVVCVLRPQEPILVQHYTLPPYVKKVPGASGTILSEETSGFALSIWGRETTVAYQSGKSIAVPPSFDTQPAASCQGFGYTCCSPDLGLAGGEQVSPVLDCPSQCYRQCQLRPAVLSFITDPLPDPATRQVVIEKNQEVRFFYVFESRQDGTIKGTIDFGDGTTQVLSEAQGETVHQYVCTQAMCRFTATLSVVNMTNQVSSITNAVNTITLIIQ